MLDLSSRYDQTDFKGMILGNNHYSIFVAKDNVDEVIYHLNELYFMVEETAVICDHDIRLLPPSKKQDLHMEAKQIQLSSQAMSKMIKACLLLKKEDEKTPFDISFSSEKNESFTLILSF